MFRHFTLTIFRLVSVFISQPEDAQCKVPKHVVVLYVINSIYIYIYHHIVMLDKYINSNLVYIYRKIL